MPGAALASPGSSVDSSMTPAVPSSLLLFNALWPETSSVRNRSPPLTFSHRQVLSAELRLEVEAKAGIH